MHPVVCVKSMRLAWLLGLLPTLACDDGPDPEDPGDPADVLEDEDADEEEDVQDPEPTLVEEGDPCTEYEATTACEGGLRYCDALGPDDALQWGQCVTEPRCELGESETCEFGEEIGGTGLRYCILHDGAPVWDDEVEFEAGCNTPLVLSFDGAPVRMESAPTATFDIDGVGACITTDWPTSVTPWLALDVDRDGLVATGAELFGSGTRLPNGRRASNGFAALAALDSNGDGRISSADDRFADLVLWSDVDGDKRGTFAELDPLATRGILSIDLDYGIDRRCDDRGNCEVERAAFAFVDAGGEIRSGDVVDIHLACQ